MVRVRVRVRARARARARMWRHATCSCPGPVPLRGSAPLELEVLGGLARAVVLELLEQRLDRCPAA